MTSRHNVGGLQPLDVSQSRQVPRVCTARSKVTRRPRGSYRRTRRRLPRYCSINVRPPTARHDGYRRSSPGTRTPPRRACAKLANSVSPIRPFSRSSHTLRPLFSLAQFTRRLPSCWPGTTTSVIEPAEADGGFGPCRHARPGAVYGEYRPSQVMSRRNRVVHKSAPISTASRSDRPETRQVSHALRCNL